MRKLNKTPYPISMADKESIIVQEDRTCGLMECNRPILKGEAHIQLVWDNGLIRVTEYLHVECYKIRKARENAHK